MTEQRYRVEWQTSPGGTWYAFTFEDGEPKPFRQDNAYEYARDQQTLGRSNPNTPKYATRVVAISDDETAARLARRERVWAHGADLLDRARVAFRQCDYRLAMDLMQQARSCAVALHAPAHSDILDTFVSRHKLQTEAIPA